VKGLLSVAKCFLVFSWCAVSGWAVDPNVHIAQYAHSTWLARDGFFSGIPRVFAQTGDGYIWVGTTAGLFRFDGVRFIPWSPPVGQSLPSPRINFLLGSKDGSLWIGTAEGLAHWQNKRLTSYRERGIVPSIVQARDGAIWFVLVEAAGTVARFCQVVGDTIRCHGSEDGVPNLNYFGLAEDQEGNFWFGTDNGTLVRWNPNTNHTDRPAGLLSPSVRGAVSDIAVASDGSLWTVTLGIGLQHMVGNTQQRAFATPEFDSGAAGSNMLLLDREGALWVTTNKNGIYRIYNGRADHFGASDGLSGDLAIHAFEDREGNVWVSTAKGIDNFRSLPVSTFSVREGLGGEDVDAVLALREGGVLASGAGFFDVIREGRVSQLKKIPPGVLVNSIFEDHLGRLWAGIGIDLTVYDGRRTQFVRKKDGGPIGMITGITEDEDSNIWIEAKGTSMTLIRIQNLKVQEEFPAPPMVSARKVAAAPNGGIWLGLINGDLARYKDGKVSTFHFPHAQNARVEQIKVNSDGSVLGATEFGLLGWKQGKQAMLTARNGLPCTGVFSFAFDNSEDLWLYTPCGLLEIKRAELEAWWSDSDATVHPKAFDFLDGALPGRAPFGPSARSADGRLWFTNNTMVQTINPEHMGENSIAPPVDIQNVIDDGHSYMASTGLALPPRPREVEFDYAALSFVAPQKVRFRYRLDGHDTEWQEPGTRRQAFYSDLRPGKYRFHVIACNNDGVWNEDGATLDFRIAPAWFQTVLFRILCIVVACLMLWGLYRLRIKQVAKAMSTRFDERLAERTRMARELHDTFLQTIQGSKLVADDALENVQDPIRTRRALEQLSEWLARATQEGRAALHSLRTSTVEKNDLAAAFRRALEDCRREVPSMEGLFSVNGEAREMHPVVRDEVYRIGYEAIRNACIHSTGNRVDVLLSYADDLSLRVRDNGVGIDPVVAETGKDGHFGLQGMRERATRIGAKLTMNSSPDSGTEIRVVVPGRIVFRKNTAPRFERIYAILQRIGL
jgi:ligand-binding sensor domain-containing protein/signal transduction histidine kinase